MITDLLKSRQELRDLVDAAAAALAAGSVPERERLDFKEEPGRRGPGGELLPGESRNTAAANYLAREVCCFANTPRGGAIVLGVEDATWQVLGTQLDVDWLRHRIYQLSDIAPLVEERDVEGQRILTLLVAEATEPVEDPDGKIRWRVGDHCVPVDRAEWWLSRQDRGGHDPMAVRTDRTAAEARPAAVLLARRHLGDEDVDTMSDEVLLRHLGVLDTTGHLTQAGVVMFCSAQQLLLSLTRLDVIGGDVVGSHEPSPTLSLLEQLGELEERIDAYNAVNPRIEGLTEEPVRSLPTRAVREAIMNGLAHRDWMDSRPTEVTWSDADVRLDVVSPGGFTGEVTAANVLTQRHARYPALADLFRALRLVDKKGVGVDRMYREMIVLGHRPPLIEEIAGPSVRTTLSGGAPVLPVLELVRQIRPPVRQRDVRIALLLYVLLHEPFVTFDSAARHLQSSRADAELALDAAQQTSVDAVPLIGRYKDTFILSDAAVQRVRASKTSPAAARRALLPYVSPKGEQVAEVVNAWLDTHSRITSGDYATLTRTSQPNGTRALSRLEGDLVERGVAAGRNAHFVRRR